MWRHNAELLQVFSLLQVASLLLKHDPFTPECCRKIKFKQLSVMQYIVEQELSVMLYIACTTHAGQSMVGRLSY